MRKWVRNLLIAVVILVAVFCLLIVVAIARPLLHRGSNDLGIHQSVDAPGAVISAREVFDIPLRLKLAKVHAVHVLYASRDASGVIQRVSGTVFKPDGAAPAGGWPIIAFGHGTSGINQPCAPSSSSGMDGAAALALGLTSAKYAVAVPDYQGLGAPGVHPYLDNVTEGHNVIDSVRALRTVFPESSKRWAAYGGSQGGGAVWGAADAAPSYAPELDLLGASALVPAADLTGLVDKALAGTLTRDQQLVLQWVVESRARMDPNFHRDDFRKGGAVAGWNTLSACDRSLAKQRDEIAKNLGPHDIGPQNPAAAQQLRDVLAAYAMPKNRSAAPLQITYGTADTFIDVAWTDAAIRRACGLGDTITIDRQPGKGHGDINGDAVIPWLLDRFAGKPAPNNC